MALQSWITKFCFLSFYIIFISFCNCEVFPVPADENDIEFWRSQGTKDIKIALNKRNNNKIAKNVVLFIGDGMGITVNTAGRIYKGQKKGHSGEEEVLAWEKFPNVGLMKTYTLDKQVPDSAATATAYLSGVKTNFYTVGVTGNVKLGDCDASLVEENRVDSILSWAQKSGKETGIVTTTRVTHATPAATYAHSSHRNWECDNEIPEDKIGCRDIATQLVEDLPGKEIKVILGGGRRQFGAALTGDDDDGCLRDVANLTDNWLAQKSEMGVSNAYVTNAEQLQNVDLEKTDYLLGLFSGGHQPFNLDRNSPSETPSLAELATAAVKRLNSSREGFFLLVEGGRIDHALHNTQPHYALDELAGMDEAVETVLKLVDLEETLVIVTADHSHVMTMNGYPERGNNIFGKSTYEYTTDKMPHTTLMFTNGPGFNFTWNGTHVSRVNLTNEDTTAEDFVFPALVPVPYGYETHGGEDVAAWATGPMSHLFHSTHEQTHVAYVMAYAACIGPFSEDCEAETRSS